jgi:hypothetical protein
MNPDQTLAILHSYLLCFLTPVLLPFSQIARFLEPFDISPGPSQPSPPVTVSVVPLSPAACMYRHICNPDQCSGHLRAAHAWRCREPERVVHQRLLPGEQQAGGLAPPGRAQCLGHLCADGRGRPAGEVQRDGAPVQHAASRGFRVDSDLWRRGRGAEDVPAAFRGILQTSWGSRFDPFQRPPFSPPSHKH